MANQTDRIAGFLLDSTPVHSAYPVKTPFQTKLAILLLAFGLSVVLSAAPATPHTHEASAPGTTPWWPQTVNPPLNHAGTNRTELLRMLGSVPETQREGAIFLLLNMPVRDLRTLSATFLINTLSNAYQVVDEMPWGRQVPRDLFLNGILPYATLSEPREDWRARLHALCKPLVQKSRTASEAAQALNQNLFPALNVRYSTKRRAPDQGPLETMQSGLATCTGLSILLVDACRSVGVPARIVGTPNWSNDSGNHTWVEIWDGAWHFMGAAEPDPNGLDHGWFVGNAALAVKASPEHAIYATSFQQTGLKFPMPWAPTSDSVSAVNITERYAQEAPPATTTDTRLAVDVLDRPAGERVAAKVTVTDLGAATSRLSGRSKGETSDMNDHLYLSLPRSRTFVVEAEHEGLAKRQFFTTTTNAEDRLILHLKGVPVRPAAPGRCDAPPTGSKRLSTRQQGRIRTALAAFFLAPADQQTGWKFPRDLDRLLIEHEPEIRDLAWQAHRASSPHPSMQLDFNNHQVRFQDHLSPYTVKQVGTRPRDGWPLFIAMHGGGGAPQELNDSQWRHMQIYYRDHPEVGGYLYLALRAPNNTWNGFYTSYVYPLIQNLLSEFLLFGDINPNKVFLMGYSHGGYGAFAIGPKMPDRFAAIHASAAAPADGAVPATLRTTPFSCMLGEKDTAYGRYDRIRSFEREIQQLRGNRTDIYPVTVDIIPNHPHSGLPDRDKIPELYPAIRNPVPRELTWILTDDVIHDFFWLHVPTAKAGMELTATCQDNHIRITSSNGVSSASILADNRLIDFNKPVVIEWNGRSTTHRLQPSLHVLCTTIRRRDDPELAATAEWTLK